MKKVSAICVALAMLVTLAAIAGAQKNSIAPNHAPPNAQTAAAPERDKPLVLTEAIPLENAKGRFDHFATGGGRLFVSALGSNAVEVINISGRILERTISGIPDPQGVAFSPETNKLFVASDEGKVYIYDGKTFESLTSVDFAGGADNLRYDAATKRIYVACGDDEQTGAIATIDATTNQCPLDLHSPDQRNS